MRKSNLIGILVVVLFLFPMINTSTDYSPATSVSNPYLPQTTDTSPFGLSSDHSTGVGPALPVTISGQVSNAGQGTLLFDSSSSGVGSVTLTDGWTGTDLQTQIDSLQWTAADVLQNGDLDDYHSEQYIVTPVTTDNDDNVPTPDGWTIVKDVIDYDSLHPQHGMYELDSNSGGNGGTWGIYVEAVLTSGYDYDPTDEMYISQMVSMPYRELNSAQVTFDYRVTSSSNMDDMVHLFVRIAGYTYKYHVFESGDTTDTWLTTTPLNIPASQMTGLSSKVMRFDIGIATDYNGVLGTSSNAYAYIDNVQVDIDVRPFPEQIDLKANGTLVWGSTTHSVYPYVPDDDNRDCYDDEGSGLDLDGYGDNGQLEVGIYSSGFLPGSLFEIGMQFPLDIPNGAIITSAFVEVEAVDSSSPFMQGMRVHVADEDNISAFTSGGAQLEDRFSWVETSIDWTVNSWVTSVDIRYKSPEIGPLVQNVVSRPGWSEGNYVCLMLSHMYSDYYQRWNTIKGTYGFDGNERARLFVEYVIPEPEDTILFFDYQKDITVDHTKVQSDLTNFPVLIDIATDSDLSSNVLSNGNDIVFTIDGSPVAHEIELFNQMTGQLVAWVNVPFLSSTTDTVITMHYGCANAPPTLGSRVWSDYETVHHLNQDPTGINFDSTSNNHDGTSYGGLGTSDSVSGQIGSAVDFDGTDDLISIGQIDTDEWTEFTMSAWIYRDLSKDARVFSKSLTTTPEDHIITLRLDTANYVTTRIQTDGTGGFGDSYSGSPAASNFTWHYIAWSWSASRGSILAYLDGDEILNQVHGGDTVYDSDAMFIIGNNDLSNDRFWAGIIDEARLTTSIRTEEWIDTEYSNQNNPSLFYSVGLQESTPSTWTDAGETHVVFTTSSPSPVSMDVIITMDVGGEAQSMDTDFNEGVNYFIESGSNIVNWTTKVMVSPPAGATAFGFSVDYPRAEWKATKVINPMGQPKTVGQDWWYQGGTLTLNASAIDFWGVWTLNFISWNFVSDVQLNAPDFNANDLAQFTITTPTVQGARVGLDLVDPNGLTWHSDYTTTSNDPTHRFPSFAYRKNITIPSTEILGSGTQYDYPAYIQIDDSDLHDPLKVRSKAEDILFAQGDTILDHEIESFDQDYFIDEARLVAWVKMNLTSGVDNIITMYYGSPIVDNLENPAGVWSNDFEAVWHLDEKTADGSTHYDSSGNKYHGSRNGNDDVVARLGYGQTFDGVQEYISIDETLAPEDDVLISGWFRLPSTHSATSPNTQVIMEKYLNDDYDMVIALVGLDYGHGTVPAGSLVFKVESGTGGATYRWTQTTTWPADTWTYIACFANEANPESNQIWVNMNWDEASGFSGGGEPANVSYIEEWQLGGGAYEAGSGMQTGYFGGILDEFRVSTTLRSDDWLRNVVQNQFNTGTFLVTGSEQVRTSPDHTLSKTIEATYPVGNWTAIVHYNDTGASVTAKTGLFETTFIVRHDTDLTLTKPTDAVGDRLSVKTAGDALFIEYELVDTDIGGNPGVAGATVTMNWTSPSTITLDDYGGGLYGTVLDTTDLGDNKQWRVEVQSYHQYYNNANEYFNVDLYHATALSAAGGSTTPANFIFNTTLTFMDTFSSTPILGATITESDGTPVTFSDNNDGTYDIQIPTSALGLQQYTFNATVPSAYLHVAQVDVEFMVRAHYTAVAVSGDMTTPYGDDTPVTIQLLDLDTGTSIGIAEVNTITFSYTGGYADDTYGSFGPLALTTANWNVGTETATLTILMSNVRYLDPGPYVFTIEIEAHETSLTVTGVTTEPYGNQTSLTIILTDLEDGSPVPIGSVSNIQLQYTHAPTFTNFGSYSIILDTSSWGVGTWTVTVVVTMSGTIYNAPSDYPFEITIRSLTTEMYHGPSTLNFTIGSDFTLDLHLNVSEAGQYYGDPVTGRTAGEFSVPAYTISIDASQQTDGVYSLTISNTYFTGGVYEIVVYFNSASDQYADTFLVIQFTYREIVSYLTSPNYPQVITPYQLDVEIILEYADADFGTGIEGATIDSPDHQAWIINTTDETGGVYSVWIDVSSLAQGTHFINLRADKSGYDARTLEFRIVIREAFTSATPSLGALDIPIGNSPIFYVDYIDIDRLLPIDNVTADTIVTSDWINFSVEYISGQYKITFHTSYSDTIAQNQVYTFTFSKPNYQTTEFTITVTIRTHNTEFRIVSSIEPTSTTGTFSISVYYGDLDNTLGINSSLAIFSVSNASGPVSSSYAYDSGLDEAGFYIIQVSASQFGLGVQAFTVYVDWTGAVAIYQDKSFVTSANVVGKESALTLLIGSEPTPYNEDMSYTFFYSDLFSSDGIHNSTGYVFIYISFQGESVNPSDIVITDFSGIEDGKYSVAFNSGIFSRIGLIYMNVFVNWSKGVSPFYANRTDVISVRVLARDTLLSITPPQSTSFNENATFTLTFEDVTGGSSSLISGLTKQEIALNISFSFVEAAGIYEISFNTDQFVSLGTKAILIDVTWVGSPFYANRIGRITYINVISRETYFEYLTPPPTQYDDQVKFNVTWTDITGGASIPITSATLQLLDGFSPIDLSEYTYFEIALGVYQVTLNTTYATGPGGYTLRAEISASEFYFSDVGINRQFAILERLTIVAANPVPDVPYNSSISIVLSYLDQFTAQAIANDSAHSYPVTIEIFPSGQTFTSTWSALTQQYELAIEWDQSWNPAIWAPGTPHAFTIRMTYAYQAPFFAENQAYVSFMIRIRESSLALTTEPETTPYLDDVTFTVFYSDDDSNGTGIDSAQIVVLNNSIPLVENTHYTLTEGSPGYYTIVVDSSYLGGFGTHILEIQVSWTGAPYHGSTTRDVSILIRQRETNVEVTVPPSQTRYLDDVIFTFVYMDTDADAAITTITSTNIHLYWLNGTEILAGFSINQVSSSFEVTISSTALSSIPVSGMTLNIVVDWNDSIAPFYKDDTTSVKVTITGRYMISDTSQIGRTPKDDILTITITLTDLDSGNPVTGTILLFNSPNGTGLVETIHYDKVEVAGVWTIDVYTDQLSGFGIFIFEVDVQWDPSKVPYYRNLTQFTLSGLIDYVRTSLQAGVPQPSSSVQFTQSVYIEITYTDLDHLVGIDGVDTSYIESQIVYLISRDTPSDLSVTALGNGVYNVSLSTTSLTSEGIYSLEISIAWGFFAAATVTPQFSVVDINTVLSPVQTSVTAYWKSDAIISVDYLDVFNGVPISSASSVSWTYGGFTEFLTETGYPGRYNATIDTSSFGAGPFSLTISAEKDGYTTSIATIILNVQTIQSEIIFHEPIGSSIDVSRGASIDIEVELWDTTYGLSIDDTQVRNETETDELQVYAMLNNSKYYMDYDVFSGRWNVTIPGSATILESLLSYDIRIFANFYNYDPVANQFKIYIIQSETQLRVMDIPDPTKLEVYYLQEVTINLTFTSDDLPPYPWIIDDGNVSWIDDTRDIYLNFTSMGNGVWSLTFNTSILGFGTVGVTFYGYPTNTTLGSTIQSMTLTVKKVPTHVVYPTEDLILYWGWFGNISLGFYDDYNNRFVSGAFVEYNYGNRYFNATNLGNGNYTLFIDTRLLDSNVRERISASFFLPNFEEWTIGFYLRVQERPTELIVDYPDQNFVSIEQGVIYLQLTMGDSIVVSLFYNDTGLFEHFLNTTFSEFIDDDSLLRGIIDANFSEFTDMRAPQYMGSNSTPIVFQEDSGYYSFTFDTSNPLLYASWDYNPIILEDRYFIFFIEIFDENRQRQIREIRIEIVTTLTEIVYQGQIVDPDVPLEYTLTNGDGFVFDFFVNDTWHGFGVDGFIFDISQGTTANIHGNSSTGNGYYTMNIVAVGYGGDAIITIILSRDFHDDVEINFLIHTEPNDIDILFLNVRNYGLPISFAIITLLGLYVRVWSIPKRIRQINGQLKTLRKGKIPKPIGDVKSRQQLTAELFNDTYAEMKITRTAAQMPEDAIPIEVPEMGELLMQLAILTNLSTEELDDFQADIAKMKISEQAAFVKEVIMQEAIRAARQDGRTVDETIALVEQQAKRRLGGEEEIAPVEVVETEDTETVFLEEEKKVTEVPDDDDTVTPVKTEEFEEVTETTSEKMSMYELEELRRDLERRGVPPHEIDTIIEQAKDLPRELVEELVKSLEGKKG